MATELPLEFRFCLQKPSEEKVKFIFQFYCCEMFPVKIKLALIYLRVFIVTSATGILWNPIFHMQQRGEQFLSLEEGHGGKRSLYLNLKYWVGPKAHSGFFDTSFWKIPNELFGQPNISSSTNSVVQNVSCFWCKYFMVFQSVRSQCCPSDEQSYGASSIHNWGLALPLF